METKNDNLCTSFEETTETNLSSDRNGDLLEDTATPEDNLLESDVDNSWEHQLNTYKRRIEELQEDYDKSYVEIGQVLIQARDVYKGHGDWIKWLKENIPFSVRHAQRMIRIVEMFSDATLVSQLGLTSSKAYILTRIGKNDINNFVKKTHHVGGETKEVKDMTRRELEQVVTAFLRGKLVSTNHEEVPSSNQSKENLKERVESNLEELKKVLSKTIASIKDSDSDIRSSWIFELEKLCKTGMDELTSESV